MKIMLGFALLSAAALAAPKAAKTPETRWPAENLSGAIDMVIPADHLVVVKAADGATFDFVVNAKTRITDNGARLNLENLSSKMNDQVNVHFVPEAKGDLARSIQIEQ